MSKLRELYEDKMNFQANKPYLEEKFQEELGETTEIALQIQKAKQAKKIAVAKYDLEILELQAKLTESGVPTTKQGKEEYVRKRIREEQLKVNTAFEHELRLRSELGDKTSDLVKEIGAKHAAPIYSLLRQTPSEELQGLVHQTENSEVGTEWDYTDNKAAHRYAFSFDRSLLKYHGDNKASVVVTWPEQVYVKGSKELTQEIVTRRAQTALDTLDGVEEAKFIEPNPYKESK